VAIWIAVISAALAVPRPVAPADLPSPDVDRRQVARAADDARVLAGEARARPLPFEVRAVGELFRRFGKAEATGQGDLGALLVDLRRVAADAASKRPLRDLSRLQAVQTELFSAALRAWELDEGSSELDELGGGLLARARENGWLKDGRLLMSQTERQVVFRMRWAELTGLRDRAPFKPTLDDWRVYLGFLLEHPEGRDASDRVRKQLGYAAALAKRDPTYPLWLARGVLFYRAGAFQESADAFTAHLAEHPDGPYALRARNHRLAALAKAEGQE
jgi:hypothetical protein